MLLWWLHAPNVKTRGLTRDRNTHSTHKMHNGLMSTGELYRWDVASTRELISIWIWWFTLRSMKRLNLFLRLSLLLLLLFIFLFLSCSLHWVLYSFRFVLFCFCFVLLFSALVLIQPKHNKTQHTAHIVNEWVMSMCMLTYVFSLCVCVCVDFMDSVGVCECLYMCWYISGEYGVSFLLPV